MRDWQITGQTKLIVEQKSVYGTDLFPNTITPSELRISHWYYTRKSFPSMNLCEILSTTTTGCSMCRLPNCSLRWARPKTLKPSRVTLWNFSSSIKSLLFGCLTCSHMSARISVTGEPQSTSRPEHWKPLMTPGTASNFRLWYKNDGWPGPLTSAAEMQLAVYPEASAISPSSSMTSCSDAGPTVETRGLKFE